MLLARQLRSSAQAVPTFASFFLHEATAMFFCWFAAVVHSRCRYGELAKSTAPIARTCMAGACNEASCVCLQTSKTYAPHLLPHCLLPSLFACHRSMNVFGHLLCSAWATRVNSLPVVRLLKLFSFRSRASSPNTFFSGIFAVCNSALSDGTMRSKSWLLSKRNSRCSNCCRLRASRRLTLKSGPW